MRPARGAGWPTMSDAIEDPKDCGQPEGDEAGERDAVSEMGEAALDAALDDSPLMADADDDGDMLRAEAAEPRDEDEPEEEDEPAEEEEEGEERAESDADDGEADLE